MARGKNMGHHFKTRSAAGVARHCDAVTYKRNSFVKTLHRLLVCHCTECRLIVFRNLSRSDLEAISIKKVRMRIFSKVICSKRFALR